MQPLEAPSTCTPARGRVHESDGGGGQRTIRRTRAPRRRLGLGAPREAPTQASDLGSMLTRASGHRARIASQPGNANPATAERERPPTIRGERVTGVGRFHLGDAELRDRAGAIRDPVEALVMKGDQNAVAREMHISLQVPVPESHRDLEGRQRVLGRLTGTTSVGERDRSRLDEKRMHVPRSSIPASRTRSAQAPDRPGEPRCSRQPP